ncbi:MAG: tetraprenyl-beta-curcumene synthase family protein [Bacillota bacterium]
MLHNYFLQWPLIARLVGGILPAVERELRGWKSHLKYCPSSFLREQALQSIESKRFHCQGGAAYALLNPAAGLDLLSFINAFQTISDYLDNLCDRLPEWPATVGAAGENAAASKDSCRELGFRNLHLAMQRALEQDGNNSEDYYRYYPYRQDGGYLHCLVRRCQSSLTRLPNHESVQAKTSFLTGLYCDLQVLKHLHPHRREKALQEWFQPYQHRFFSFFWHEFAAAAGSTLGVFALLATASRSDWREEEGTALFDLYFPWICGLHILLDYYIDQAEDRREGDLNFVFYYENTDHCLQRMRFFIEQALQRAVSVQHAHFHRTIIKGLLALYLSDPKIREQGLEKQARGLLETTGEGDTFILYHTCRLLRRCGIL